MNKKIEIGLRLKEFAKKKFGGIAGLERHLGKPAAYFQNYINGRSYLGGELLSKLEELECDINWLLNGTKNKISEPANNYAVNQSIENNGENLEMDKSQIAHSTINETHNNGVNDSLTMELILSQREQIKYLHETISSIRADHVTLHEQNTLLNRTVDSTLVHLCKICEECCSLHKSAHKKVDIIADSISKKKKN